MGLFTGNKYKSYGKKVINTGEDTLKKAQKLRQDIDDTIPRSFKGTSANKAHAVAYEIASALEACGNNIKNIGHGIKNIAESNDVD